jgi:tRNA-2-methylthio-N6-dimethylallyladenosine synthase
MRWKDDIPEAVKEDRLQRLLALQNGIYAKQRQAMLNAEVEVLVERFSRKENTLLKGRTRCSKSVLLPGGEELIGTLQRVKIHSYSHQTLMGA